MSTNRSIAVLVNNDITQDFQVTFNGAPLNLTGLSPQVVIKASATATDGSGTTYTTSSGISVTNAALGQLTLTVPRASNTTVGTFWYRLDIIGGGGSVTTSMYGNWVVLAV